LPFAIFIAVVTVGLVLVAGRMYQRWGAARDQARFPPPGTLVDVGGHRLHLMVTADGNSGPAVIFESGLMSTILSWRELQPEIAKSSRTVAYDRAGLGWSDGGPTHRDAAQIVEELRSLLDLAEIAPPYILVGHSFAGLTTRLFAAKFPNEVAGLILIDPVVPEEWNPASEHNRQRIRTGARILRRAAGLSRCGALRFVSLLLLSGVKPIAEPLVRLMSKGAPEGDGTTRSPLFWNLPPAERAMAPVFWVLPKFTETIASQLENLPRSAEQVAAAGPLTNIPITVISAANTPPARRQEHVAIAKLSTLGKHITAEGSGHWVMQDEPELVLQAIRDVIRQVPEPQVAAKAAG
jgi:pimeloyl-ACP methyl ester carboxylesterase